MEDKQLWGEAFNFSTESPKSVIEIVNDILRIMNSPLKPVILNQAKNEIKDQYLSAQKARKMLNWSPKYAFEDGLNETIGWYRDFFKMKVW
jgi:CDP-glucose 4,6-dehydratase